MADVRHGGQRRQPPGTLLWCVHVGYLHRPGPDGRIIQEVTQRVGLRVEEGPGKGWCQWSGLSPPQNGAVAPRLCPQSQETQPPPLLLLSWSAPAELPRCSRTALFCSSHVTSTGRLAGRDMSLLASCSGICHFCSLSPGGLQAWVS